METGNVTCPNCKKEVPNNVIYKCVRCFTEYCVACDDTREGRVCPKCGMSARIVIGQDKK